MKATEAAKIRDEFNERSSSFNQILGLIKGAAEEGQSHIIVFFIVPSFNRKSLEKMGYTFKTSHHHPGNPDRTMISW